MGAAQNLEHDGIYISAEQWAEIQETLRLVRVYYNPKSHEIADRVNKARNNG